MASLVIIYKKYNFNIYNAGPCQFIIHNNKLDFNSHHTHIRNFKTAKYIIDLAIHKSIPKHLSNYLLTSLIRISDDEEYIEKLNTMILSNKEKRKGTSYKDKKYSYKNTRGVKNNG